MSETTRRRFLKTASIGAATMGILNFLPNVARADTPACPPQGATTPVLPSAPVADTPGHSLVSTSPIVVFIDNPASGQGVIFVGEQRFELNNPAAIQALTSAIG